MVALARPEAAHELDEGSDLRVEDTLVDVHSDLVDTVHKLQVERVQQRFLLHGILNRETADTHGILHRAHGILPTQRTL